MYSSGLVNTLVTHANIEGFGLTPLSGGRRGYMPPLLKTKTEFTKTRAFPTKSGQNITTSVGFTKTRSFPTKSGQNISSYVGFTKTRASAIKSGQN